MEGSLAFFCTKCSSIVFGSVETYKMNYVMLGALDESPSLNPQWPTYTNYKVDWYEISDGLLQHKEKLVR